MKLAIPAPLDNPTRPFEGKRPRRPSLLKVKQMNSSVVRTLKRIAILSVAGAIAMSASTMTGPSAFAASPSANNSGQVPLDQQKKPDKNKPGTQTQGQQNGQALKNQPTGQQQVQQLKNQNGGQSQIQKNAQALQNQPAGQPPKTTEKVQQLNNQNVTQQQTQQQKNLKNGQQVGQGQSYQPPKNNQNGQAQNNQNGQTKNNSGKQRYDWSSYQPGHQPPQWQQHNADFNARSYQWNRTSNQRYHYQNYERPQGWYAQRWVYGQILPTLFWSQAYWLTSYYNFGLIDPPYGFVWVQNGNDALLVNVQTGQILSVEYNVFYA
jgi:Ni/Co efflux regulator RcnB